MENLGDLKATADVENNSRGGSAPEFSVVFERISMALWHLSYDEGH